MKKKKYIVNVVRTYNVEAANKREAVEMAEELLIEDFHDEESLVAIFDFEVRDENEETQVKG